MRRANKEVGRLEPLTLLAIAAAAGFVFKQFGHHLKRPVVRPEHSYARDTVFRTSERKENSQDIEVLPEYDLVRSLVKKHFPLIFVTGGAGTGKSTFIHWLVQQFEGKALLAAPTGMAAINIEGKTLHSLCQLPPAWILKDDIKYDPRRREIREAKLLIIDEVSMVTANLLDGVSAFFRLNRGVDKPFGGVPVVMVGDLFQLPPVVTEQTRELFERTYGSARFYNAKCLAQSTYYAVELKKAFRQTEQELVDALGKLREGIDIASTIATLNQRCRVIETPPKGAVWLSPRNVEVDTRNQKELARLQTEQHVYKGTISGQFKTDRVPSPVELVLKPGAQVMFTKNDSPFKRWVNGTVGTVKQCFSDHVTVELLDSGATVEARAVKWADYQYRWTEVSGEIERKEIGSFSQIPLVLAWAMTIHKSQGKTIERVHVDLGAGAFETGQTYVALSRCRSIEGLTLARPLLEKDFLLDHEAKAFYDALRLVIQNLPPDQFAKSMATAR